jgi:hypothetical protein
MTRAPLFFVLGFHSLLSCGTCMAASIPRFDGVWDTVLSCANSNGALGYVFDFPATVKDGILHGEKGIKGQPGWLQLDGKIGDDGTASILATGRVGAAPFAVGQRPAGTEYGYNIRAKFSDDSGQGSRVEGRPCSVTFTRQK